MTPEQTRLFQQSWNEVVPNAYAMARLLCDLLFEIDPRAVGLFMGTNKEHQRRKPFDMLDTVVDKIDEFPSLLPPLQALDRRFSRNGVTDQFQPDHSIALG